MNLLQAIEARLPEGYTIRDRLGTGATSWVYVAQHAGTGERLVVKILHPGTVKVSSLERFHREIAMLQQMSHPKIVPILEPGEVDDALYFTMPYLGDQTLRQRLDAKGPLTVRDALHITRDVVEALGYAHKRGIVHRDVKPENILLGANNAFLMDFGFANAPGLMSADAATAEAQLIVGTPGYLSPEQITGRRPGDWRSDFYSLGCVLYEMLTGQLPIPSSTVQRAITMRKFDEEPPADPRLLRPDLPDDVVTIVRKNLAWSPNDRYATAFALQMSLEATLERLNGALV